MNILQDMRISHKISALMMGLVFGFIAIGITYYMQLESDTAVREQERRVSEFQNQINDLNLSQLKLQNIANRYLSTKQVGQLDNYNALTKTMREDLQDIKRKSTQFNINKPIAALEKNILEQIKLHRNAFAELENIGLNETEGARRDTAIAALTLENALSQLNEAVALSTFLSLRRIANDFVLSANPQYLDEISSVQRELEANLTSIDTKRGSSLQDAFNQYQISFFKLRSSVENLDTIADQLVNTQQAINASLNATLAEMASISEAARKLVEKQTQMTQVIVTVIIFSVALGTAVGVYLIYKSIIFPLVHIQGVVNRINRGKSKTRVKHLSQDELGELGVAFNKLLDERIQSLHEQSFENERLNNSIISLIKAIGAIANKDLTVKVPVSSDITGTISDAVNLLTSETSKTLNEVKDISVQVNQVSETLTSQSQTVIQFADNERRQVLATSKALDALANAMTDVAKRSEYVIKAASQATHNTQSARETVVMTVDSIRDIRETISETEKRMKRLGDRSQEISGIVNLINTIAERTHILALNASMHAASAGEAGKGFAVVAEEVQRLAEGARESTDEISSMVNNMRVETSDAVNVMNTLISQVADGSQMAERAGEKMKATEKATHELAKNVKVIAEQAIKQADIANRVRDRSTIIKNFTEKTGKELEQQSVQTRSLKHFAQVLLDRVNTFVLPNEVNEDTQQNKSVTEIKQYKDAS